MIVLGFLLSPLRKLVQACWRKWNYSSIRTHPSLLHLRIFFYRFNAFLLGKVKEKPCRNAECPRFLGPLSPLSPPLISNSAFSLARFLRHTPPLGYCSQLLVRFSDDNEESASKSLSTLAPHVLVDLLQRDGEAASAVSRCDAPHPCCFRFSPACKPHEIGVVSHPCTSLAGATLRLPSLLPPSTLRSSMIVSAFFGSAFVAGAHICICVMGMVRRQAPSRSSPPVGDKSLPEPTPSSRFPAFGLPYVPP